MADQENREDRWADQNLRMIGRRLRLPPDPTPQQQALWKQEPTHSATDHVEHRSFRARGARFVRRHRLLTVATSAIAASIVLAVLLVTPRSAIVEASMILSSLRQTLLDGFQMSFENIGDEGVYVDGQVIVTLRPVPGARLHTARAADPSEVQVASVYAQAHLRGDDSDENRAGLDLQAILALSDESQWAYLKTVGLPDEMLEDEPLAWVLVGLTGGGLLLDLDGMRDLFRPEGGEGPDKGASSREQEAAADRERPGREAPAQNDIAQLMKDFLVGRAGAEQIDRMLALIAQTARDVSLAEVEPGLRVLTVREFKLDAIAADASQLADMTLEVTYREGRGIESAVLEHIGRYDGTLRLSPINGYLDQGLFDKRNVVRPGATAVWDLSSLQPVLKLLLARDH